MHSCMFKKYAFSLRPLSKKLNNYNVSCVEYVQLSCLTLVKNFPSQRDFELWFIQQLFGVDQFKIENLVILVGQARILKID